MSSRGGVSKKRSRPARTSGGGEKTLNNNSTNPSANDVPPPSSVSVPTDGTSDTHASAYEIGSSASVGVSSSPLADSTNFEKDDSNPLSLPTSDNGNIQTTTTPTTTTPATVTPSTYNSTTTNDTHSPSVRASKQRKIADGDDVTTPTAGGNLALDSSNTANLTPNTTTTTNSTPSTSVATSAAASTSDATTGDGTMVDEPPAGSSTNAADGTPIASSSPIAETPTTNASSDLASPSPSTTTTTVAPSAPRAVVPPFPSLPAGMRVGYVARFYWEHFPSCPPNAFEPYTPPVYTDVVASVPAFFHQIITILASVHAKWFNRDVVKDLDKRIVRPLDSRDISTDASIDRKLSVRVTLPQSKETREYIVTACRKEQLKLIHADEIEGGLVGKMKLCPLLIDSMMVNQGGKFSILAGVGSRRYESSNVASAHTRVTRAEDDLDMNEVGPSHFECTCQTKSGGGLKAEATDGSDAASSLTSAGDHIGMEDISSDAPIRSGSFNDSTAKVPHIMRSPPHSGSGSHAHQDTNCAGCVNWQKKHAKQSKVIEKLKQELQSVHDERGLWEQKWSDERDHNIRLWEKTLLIQKQLRDMSRPLGVSLTHAMNHISSAPPQQPVQPSIATTTAPSQLNAPASNTSQMTTSVSPLGQPIHMVGVGMPTGGYGYVPMPDAQGLIPVDPYAGAAIATQPLTADQLQQHLHPTELQSNYPINIQQQLAKSRLLHQQQQPPQAQPITQPMQG